MNMLASSILLAALLGQGQAQRPPVTLHVGDPAPALTVTKWLKGAPQTDLKDGKVHVVEVWATWCGPCKVGMPHLSEIAKKFGDRVSVVGVSAWERKDDVAKPEAFVRQAGDMMAYNVAYDAPKGPISKDWMQAAGQYGIPCAFVVDKAGRIGWIGHPLMGLDQAVQLATEDKLDKEAAAAIDKTWEANLAKLDDTMKAEEAAEKAGKVDEALALNDQALAQGPFIAPDYAATRYALLTAKDPAAAKAYGEAVLKESGNAPYVLRSVADGIVDEKSAVKGDRDYALAQRLFDASFRCMAPTAGALQSLAAADLKLGDKAKAADAQAKAVALMEETLKATDYGTTPRGLKAKADAEKALADAQAKLATYRA